MKIREEKAISLSHTDLLELFKQTQQQLAHSQEQVEKLLEQNQQLQHQLDKLTRMIFGQRSERQNKGKEKKASSKKDTTNTSCVNKDDKESNGNGRRKLPEDLPRTVIKHEIDIETQRCSCCEGKLRLIGKEVSEQLNLIPSKLYVIEHRCYKYACRWCGTLTIAQKPEQPIDKGLAGAGLLADTLISKYQDHTPLYRQSLRYERMGYALPRSTLCDWVIQCASRLAPIVEAMHKHMISRAAKIHSDDTTIPVLAKEKTHTGRLWVYIGQGEQVSPSVVFQYTKTRSSKAPKKFLANYQGYLQADAYAGYNACYESGDIIEVGCWAHARRKFIDALNQVEDKDMAQQAVDIIASLYAVERRAKGMCDIERFYYRKHDAKPILRRFKRWLIKLNQVALPKSPLGTALSYTLNHWDALNNYLKHGVCAIDNNIAERAIKSVVIGRKNYLFAGSHDGAQHAATIYSLVETCKLNNINTFEYFTDVLERLPTTLNADIDLLIPYNWKKLKSQVKV